MKEIRTYGAMVVPSLAVLLLAAWGWVGRASAAPIVHTANGDVAGAVRTPGVESFLGIPFAAAPVGALRWREPQPAAAWRGVRPALSFGKDCIQEPQAHPPGPGFVNPTSEDCLYLNIWRPEKAAGKPLAVMVWIHGGAFIMGAGSFPSYEGTAFAKDGVVLVTFNYRLGRFGTFAHPALSRAQAGRPLVNYGLLDQIAALKWVKANITAFGGDPENVTIFGESAGASSVNFLMTSPLAMGLFSKAISESGGASSDLKSLAAAEVDGRAWAASVGAADADAADLRALPADVVWGGPVVVPAFPVIDDRIVTTATDEAFARGAFAQVPYMVGANSHEESLLRWLPGADERYFASMGAAGGALLKLYAAEGVDRDRAVARLWGEAVMVAPARFRAKQVARAGRMAWLYRYSYVPDAAQGMTAGAGHEAEMEMVFKNPDVRWPSKWSAADAAMASAVNRYWVNFAKTGDPNGPGLPRWPAYSVAGDELMEFTNSGPVVARNFARERLDTIERATYARKGRARDN
jgi:para-nitrobenzyl esterase